MDSLTGDSLISLFFSGESFRSGGCNGGSRDRGPLLMMLLLEMVLAVIVEREVTGMLLRFHFLDSCDDDCVDDCVLVFGVAAASGGEVAIVALATGTVMLLVLLGAERRRLHSLILVPLTLSSIHNLLSLTVTVTV